MSALDVQRLREAMAAARETVADAAVRSGRRAGDVEVILAGKYVPAEEAYVLRDAGVTVVGENRLQDLQAKHAVLGDAVVFDFIGHLQRRKVKAVLPLVRMIHSLDSLELAQELSARSVATVLPLVQVNIAAEPTKGGILPTQIDRFVEAVGAYPNIVLAGLMTLPPAASDPNDSRPHFARLRDLNERLAAEWVGRHDFRELSMGTSQDFAIAAEEGATRVRIGRSVINLSQVS